MPMKFWAKLVMAKTSIEWCDRTWNPTTGCTKVDNRDQSEVIAALEARIEAPAIPEGKRLKAYTAFLESKRLVAETKGFDISGTASILWDFQADIVRWACRRGRAAIFADCGLGKTLMQLEWARHVSKFGPVLIVAPLSVSDQTIAEAAKLNMAVRYVRRYDHGERVQITNYEMIHTFIGGDSSGIVLDESSILKS